MLKNSEKKIDGNEVVNSPLGKNSTYISTYAAELLFPISRKIKRDEIHVPELLPFKGFDTWNAYEVSWLNSKGKPVVVIGQFDISCTSKNIVESKSFKLYLNSFNNTQFDSLDEVQGILSRDIREAVDGTVNVKLFGLDELCGQKIETFSGKCIDDYDVACDRYTPSPGYLTCALTNNVEESLFSNLLKSNCLVTGQPDWGSVQIEYKGPKIDEIGLLQYIVSFRNHNEFHEQCVERIFMDILNHCKPEVLTVEARYTRRGGLDINPVRSTTISSSEKNIRMARQ
jgi:7-cyano-7-deazaguanine reductase